MICRVRTHLVSVLATGISVAAFSAPLMAAELPQIKLSDANKVPACVTPGRLTAFLEQRNPKLDDKFATIAADYARIGDELNIRWDIAFFQMLLETGNLTFTGDVSAKQNNFAGLGATGRKEPGETFSDVPTGVKAHMQHLLLYSGEHLDDPVADRTRKVQEWGVLTDWQKSIKGPMTFTQLARQWAPGSRNYSRDISNISDAFMDGPCRGPDPKPEMMALWKPGTAAGAAPESDATSTAVTAKKVDGPSVTGYELARRANEQARSSGSYIRSGLGAGILASMADAPDKAAEGAEAPAVKILNAPAAEDATAKSGNEGDPATIQTASLATGVKGLEAPAKAKCKVWTASYGGTRAVIIKATAEGQENYTVLDVNEATAQRETDAYIAAYAKGGAKVAEFTTPSQALDKAFELCPEG